METVEYKNVSFTVWDVGGQDKVRFCFSMSIKEVKLIVDKKLEEKIKLHFFGFYFYCR